jgi:hypothetical protein
VRRNGPANEIRHTLVFLHLMKYTLQRKHKHWLKKLLLVAEKRFYVEVLPFKTLLRTFSGRFLVILAPVRMMGS